MSSFLGDLLCQDGSSLFVSRLVQSYWLAGNIGVFFVDGEVLYMDSSN